MRRYWLTTVIPALRRKGNPAVSLVPLPNIAVKIRPLGSVLQPKDRNDEWDAVFVI